VDRATVDKIRADSGMGEIPERYERKEHSLEMHMPYLYKVCERAFASPADFPKIVPLLIGSHGFEGEQQVGRLLAPYLADPANAFIVSSDFCHWGHHAFSYTPYSPDLTMEKLTWLSPSSRAPDGAPIHESIKMLDEAAMDAVKSGSHAAFFENLKLTENTVCGRHPIGVAMAAMEVHARQLGAAEGPRFSIVKYDRSNLVTRANGHSVSYVSAYAVL
jgi:AmmeMemoRadiSam system protein B